MRIGEENAITLLNYCGGDPGVNHPSRLPPPPAACRRLVDGRDEGQSDGDLRRRRFLAYIHLCHGAFRKPRSKKRSC